MNFYNEIDFKAAAWLRELIFNGLIPPGHVDTRSILEIKPDELKPYTQCHFFAGIGGWSLALQLAQWPTDRSVWTGSCPCQPFSVAGKGLGTSDERHLWPTFFNLIRECRPVVVFGEQVASGPALGWLDGVFSDLEGEDYACGATDLCAAGVGAPHIRQRLYWVADAQQSRQCGRDKRGFGTGGKQMEKQENRPHSANQSSNGRENADRTDVWKRVVHFADCDEDGNCPVCGIDFADCGCPGPTQDGYQYEDREDGLWAFWVGESVEPGLEGQSGHGHDGHKPKRIDPSEDRPASTSGNAGHWDNYDLLPCFDGKKRRVESGTFPLAHGVSGRVAQLHGLGNAIVPQVAQAFIEAFLDSK